MILDKLDTGLARLQRDRVLAAAAVVLIRVFDRGRGPVGIDDEILRRGCGIGNVRAAGGCRVPPGKIHAGARGRLQCGIGLAARVAQDTVVLQRAAVRHMDKVTEAGIALVSGIVAIEIDLQLADTPLEHFGRIAAAHADPRAPRIGHADLGIVPARQQSGHAAAREHGGAVELQGGQRVELLLQLLGVLHLHHKLLGGQGVGAHGEAVQNDLDGHQHRRFDQTQPVHARAHRHADGGGAPHTGGGGQAPDGVAVFEDNAGAQKGNAADHLRRDTGRVGAPQAVNGGHIDKGVLGQDHKQRRGAGDDAVGADARLLLPLAALQSHQRAQSRRQQQTDQKFQIVI